MIWAGKGLKIHQVPIPHSDITAILYFLPKRTIFVVSVYIPHSTNSSEDEPKLLARLDLIKKTFLDKKESIPNLELIVCGDFNRWDTLWGGDHLASHSRQGEGRSIVEFISDLDLQLLLPRGTITYLGNSRGGESTIDLVMATNRLHSERTRCQTHETEHGSDYLTILTEFVTSAPAPIFAPRQMYKNARWDVFTNFVKSQLASIEAIDCTTAVDQYTARLTKVILEGIELTVPLSKPSPYNKRWWIEDLSQLRKGFTLLRNQARRHRRQTGNNNSLLTSAAKSAKREYHSALRKQKKQHWEEFLDVAGNIWDACRYIDDNPNTTSFAPVPSLQTSPSAKVTTNAEIAQGYLQSFFRRCLIMCGDRQTSKKCRDINFLCHLSQLKKLPKQYFQPHP